MFSTRLIRQYTRSIHTGSKAQAIAAQHVTKDASANAHTHRQAIFESLGKVEFNGNKNAHTVAGN